MACHLTNFLVRVPFLYKVDGSHGRFTLWSFLLVHIQFTTSEPKGFVILWFFKEIRPWKLDHEKWPSSMVRLHGPWCKHALSNPWANMLGSGFVALAPPYLCVCVGVWRERILGEELSIGSNLPRLLFLSVVNYWFLIEHNLFGSQDPGRCFETPNISKEAMTLLSPLHREPPLATPNQKSLHQEYGSKSMRLRFCLIHINMKYTSLLK